MEHIGTFEDSYDVPYAVRLTHSTALDKLEESIKSHKLAISRDEWSAITNEVDKFEEDAEMIYYDSYTESIIEMYRIRGEECPWSIDDLEAAENEYLENIGRDYVHSTIIKTELFE